MLRSTSDELTPDEFNVTAGDGVTVIVRKKDLNQDVSVMWTPGNEFGTYETNWVVDYNTITGEALDSMSYTKEINGYTFIVMGSDEEVMEEAYISDAQLEWLDESLAAATADGKPVFVILHQPLKDTHGLPIPWGNGTNKNAGHVGDQSEEIQAILNEYKNVILISGHLHLGFGQYTYEKVGNFHAVNVPAIGKGNADGDYNEFSTGYSVEVYENEVLFRARDYANGKYLADYDFTITVE